MKVIDLLNKIANGEEVPKKIKYSDIEYDFNNNEYINEYGVNLLQHVTYAEYIMTHTVEIIEEDKEIEELDLNLYHDEPANIDDLAYKVNELIKAVNKLKKGIS